jgi:hypothetical protein
MTPIRPLHHSIAGRPPIPAAVLDAMVERGARALAVWHGLDPDDSHQSTTKAWEDFTDEARACILAALSTGDA